jgi:saccharopine dehydrogenase-like NADP-dependent oxidoreductase
MTGTIRVLKEGGYQQVKPLVRTDIFYPGYGHLPVWSVGHPEAVTLPRVLPGLMACTNVMVGGEDGFLGLQVLAGLVDTGVLTIHQAADEIAKDFAKKTEAKKSPKPLASHAPALFGWARGSLLGKPTVAAAQVLSLPPGGMASATSVPLSLAVPLFQQGFGGRVGVFSPEELINPVAFFDLLAPRCAGHFSSGETLVAIDVSQLDA